MNPITIINIITSLIDRFIPDKAAALQAKNSLSQFTQGREFDLMLAQIRVNREEAKHPSLFVAGWRPFLGWICSIALLYQTVLIYILPMQENAPDIDTTLLLSVLGGMLGLGQILRTSEKKRGISRNNLKEQ